MAGYVDLLTWKRRNHYQWFSAMDYPFFSICAPLDITGFYSCIKQKNEPFFIPFLYLVTKAANQIEEFRYRIRPEGIFLHDTVHPSYTVMSREDLFSFCYTEFTAEYPEFRSHAMHAMEVVKSDGVLSDDVRDDTLYITSIPWVSFTSVTHPISMNKTDSVPRISWGRFEEKDGKRSIPMALSLHHGLADGIHAGRFFQTLQDYLDHPLEHIMLS
jgi:chloramphenicol O-acetyltransferase type A